MVRAEIAVKPIKNVLCPIDCSPSSKIALEYGLFVAKHFGGRARVVHVWHVSAHIRPDLSVWMQAGGQQPVAKVVETEARDETQRFLATIPEAAGVEAQVVEGEPWRVITEMAERDGFDLIVMGTHGRSGLAHLAIGSVAERVVRHAPCPVLTVPHKLAKA
jgi:nucleotide-binding universal stress UspA family protein